MSDTTSFTDPIFLQRFGLFRWNVIDYFLHPLNPFRTSVNTSNEVLAMQGTSIAVLMQQGFFQQEVLTPEAAEREYHKALSRLTGEQYELVPPGGGGGGGGGGGTNAPNGNGNSNNNDNDNTDSTSYAQPSALYTIRHVLRTSPSSTKILGVYYIVEGVIYRSPAVRSLMKSNVARTLGCLSGATDSLSRCARYQPSLGYMWVFESSSEKEHSPYELMRLHKQRKRRKVLDHRKPGERTAAEEEGIRATEALDQILVRLSKSRYVKGEATKKPAAIPGAAAPVTTAKRASTTAVSSDDKS